MKNFRNYRMLFLDALPQAGSTGSITLMSELLQTEKVSSRQALSWYLSLPLSKFTTIDVIKSLLVNQYTQT